jgi:hypothetical protein
MDNSLRATLHPEFLKDMSYVLADGSVGKTEFLCYFFVGQPSSEQVQNTNFLRS